MVSFNLYAIAFALVAATVASARPKTSPPNLYPDTTERCKTITIGKEDEHRIRVLDNLERKEPFKGISSDLTFTSKVKNDQTYVYYVDKTTASVFKSPSNTAPMKMRFKMTYKTGHEYSYIEVKPKQHCIVQGSDQWPNLVQVDYFKLAKKER